MSEKINLAEILKDCPKGTKLYSPICGECELIKIYNSLGFDVINETGNVFNFAYDGRYDLNGECCIFPSKENRDWSTFKRPFKEGDVVVCEIDGRNPQMFILKSQPNNNRRGYCYIGYDFKYNKLFSEVNLYFDRLATEEEKQKLFKAIKANGYKWTAETKTLEKLIEPKFKVGDWVEFNYYKRKPAKVIRIENNVYYLSSGDTFMFQDEHAWDLTTNKFDITTLKPFESKVLVRDTDSGKWSPTFWGFYNIDNAMNYPYECCGNSFAQCIPYKGNEYLLGTTNDCDEYYKNWK